MAPKATFVLSENPFWPKFPLSCLSIGAQRIMVSNGSLKTINIQTNIFETNGLLSIERTSFINVLLSRFIHSINRKGLTYKVKVNHLADQTKEELKRLRGKKKSDGKYNGGQEFKPDKLKPEDIPSSYNWRLYGMSA